MLRGVEFLEFAVDAETGAEIRTLLKSLCFRLERRHKSKPVELWRQGAINIVVNEAQDGYAYDALTANGPGLCDMGLKVDSAKQTVARTTSLGVKSVHQPVGVDELDIPAIEGIGHSLIHLLMRNPTYTMFGRWNLTRNRKTKSSPRRAAAH